MKRDRAERINSEPGRFQSENYDLALGDKMNMWQAAAKGDVEALIGFLTRGAHVDVLEGNEERTPLSCAVLYDQLDAARFLIDNGAQPNVQDLFGYTPLMLAVMDGNGPMTELLLEKGADVTIEDLQDPPETALAKAYRYGREHIIELLKQAEAKR